MIDVQFGELKCFEQEQAIPEKGYLGVGRFDKNTIIVEWSKCREQFHRKLTEAQQSVFYLAMPPNKEESIACLIYKIEEIISFNFPVEKSKFCRTNKDYALWIEPSSFWKECNAKMSLFTIFVRAGMDYDYKKDNFDDVIYKQNLICEVSYSVERFLYGFTKFIPLTENESKLDVGWVNLFKNKSKEQVRKQLVSPVKKETYLIGGTTLWT